MLIALQFNYNTGKWRADPWTTNEDWRYAMSYILLVPDWDSRLIVVGY